MRVSVRRENLWAQRYKSPRVSVFLYSECVIKVAFGWHEKKKEEEIISIQKSDFSPVRLCLYDYSLNLDLLFVILCLPGHIGKPLLMLVF